MLPVTRKIYCCPESQRILVEKVLAVNKPTIIVLASGSALNPMAEKSDAIIQAWYPGQLGGTALADILFGEVSPSGKLPVTFYETADLLPDFSDYSMKNRTYRYAENNVLYPFGFGLTYSKTEVSNLVYNAKDGTATCEVQNVGDVDTDEVIQLYIKDIDSKWATSNPQLCGFRRVCLQKGERIAVTFEVPKNAFTVVKEDGERCIEGPRFTLYAGVSQPDELSMTLAGNDMRQHNHCEKIRINYHIIIFLKRKLILLLASLLYSYIY